MSGRNGNRFYEEAVEKIEYYIIEHKLAPHDKLPSERDFCEMWDFNRTTLRSAIQRLVVEGKLYQKKGSGTYLAEPKFLRNLQNLESLSLDVSSSGHELQSSVLSAEVIESNKQIMKKLQVPLGRKVYVLTRLRYIDGEPSTIETSFMDHQRFEAVEAHDFSKESLYSVLENEYGVHIADGEESVGIAYATEYEAQLLGLVPGQAVFYLTGIVYDDDRKPVEYFKTIARVDKIRFASMLRRREEG